VSPIHIDRKWTPAVRYAARRYRREIKRAQSKFQRTIAAGTTEGEATSVMCAEEAKAILDMLNRLGYGGDRKKAPARHRLELELQVHERDEGASINFFRLFMANRQEQALEQVFSRKGRERTKVEAERLRWTHIDELRASLQARKAAFEWMAQYFGRLELGKKYREFAKVQFDDTLDDEAKAAYMSLLFAQIAERTSRSKDDVLTEFNEMVQSLGLNVASAEIELEGKETD
jgi:hypothetical protein